MVLDSYRRFADRILIPIAERFKNVSPDVFTWLALVFSFFTGYAFYTGAEKFLLLASLFVAISGFCDAMDGALARVSKKASRRGDFLDHVLDKYADVFIIGGLIFSPWAREWIGILALIGVMMLSYMGTQAQALVGKRDLSGYVGRATRLLILIIAPALHYFLLNFGISEIYGFTVLEWMLILFAVVANIDALRRAFNTWRQL